MANPTQSERLKEKAKVTLGRVLAGLESRQAPVVGQIVRIIKKVSGKADRMSVSDLAEFISAEPTTMSRIISIAGSLGYNSTGAEITSVHQAISLIGFERVRNLAVSILLFENALSERVAEINRHLAGLALVTGLMGAEMGRGRVRVDPDLAFVCGALRGYGPMLAANFMAEDYALVLRAKPDATGGDPFRSVFGLTALELGRQALACLQLAKPILNSFVVVSAQTLQRASVSPTTALIATVDLSWRMAELIQAPDLTADNFDARREALTLEYDRAFRLNKDTTKDLLAAVAIKLESLTLGGGFSVRSMSLFRRLECLAVGRQLPPERSE